MQDDKSKLMSKEVSNSREEATELSLRPKTFDAYVGQGRVKRELMVYIAAAKKREEALDHVLLYGPPGLGKTTLAMVIANELGVNIKTTSGPVIEKPGDLVALLNDLQPGDVLFIDEIHRLPRVIEEILYSAMEDFYIDIVVGEGSTAHPVHFPLPPFTLIGATTQAGHLSAPLRERFGIVMRMNYYTATELGQIVSRSAKIFNFKLQKAGARGLALRSRGTPRIANRLLRRVRDFAEVKGESEISLTLVDSALNLLQVDAVGLNEIDRKLLSTIINHYGGGPVGLHTLAANIGEEASTLEEIYEPYLLQIGFIARTPRGRMATPTAYHHLGYQLPEEK